MKILAINGSPRKNWNTATLLKHALAGAASEGAETELLHLYDLDYKGCISCFACKRIGGESYGRCAVKDGLAEVLEKVAACDGFLLGSPVYLSEVTGMTRAFLERLVFPYLAYSKGYRKLFPRMIKTGFIYTMNVSDAVLEKVGYPELFGKMESMIGRVFGPGESLYSTDTLQFDDYSKYVSDMFDPEAKAARRREVFPEDCKKAFEMGARMGR